MASLESSHPIPPLHSHYTSVSPHPTSSASTSHTPVPKHPTQTIPAHTLQKVRVLASRASEEIQRIVQLCMLVQDHKSVEGKDYSLYTVQSGEGKNRSKEVEISTKAIKNQHAQSFAKRLRQEAEEIHKQLDGKREFFNTALPELNKQGWILKDGKDVSVEIDCGFRKVGSSLPPYPNALFGYFFENHQQVLRLDNVPQALLNIEIEIVGPEITSKALLHIYNNDSTDTTRLLNAQKSLFADECFTAIAQESKSSVIESFIEAYISSESMKFRLENNISVSLRKLMHTPNQDTSLPSAKGEATDTDIKETSSSLPLDVAPNSQLTAEYCRSMMKSCVIDYLLARAAAASSTAQRKPVVTLGFLQGLSEWIRSFSFSHSIFRILQDLALKCTDISPPEQVISSLQPYNNNISINVFEDTSLRFRVAGHAKCECFINGSEVPVSMTSATELGFLIRYHYAEAVFEIMKLLVAKQVSDVPHLPADFARRDILVQNKEKYDTNSKGVYALTLCVLQKYEQVQLRIQRKGRERTVESADSEDAASRRWQTMWHTKKQIGGEIDAIELVLIGPEVNSEWRSILQHELHQVM